MDPGFLVDGILRSVMGGGRKRSRRAVRYLTGGGGSLLSTAMSHPTAVLTAAGVAWGIFETLQNSGNSAGAGLSGGGLGATAAASTAPVPPLPNVGPPSAPAGASQDMLRIVRLAVSAAHADGAMNDQERAAILQQARDQGVAELLEQELARPRPLSEIVAGVSDAAERATMYVLAFTIMRADEQLTGAERIYLAQLANLLGLDRATVERLEKDTGERIDALGDQGQPGG